MKRLIVAYRRLPSPTNRRKLAAYIAKHPMVICVATSEELEFLVANHFVS